jgi:hypothetical protein
LKFGVGEFDLTLEERKKKMKKLSTTTICAFLGCAVLAFGVPALAEVYTFDDLTAGDISGQDNWTVNAGTGVSVIADGSGKYMSGPNDSGVYRINDANWSFTNPIVSGVGGTIEMTVDILGSGSRVLASLGASAPAFGKESGVFRIRQGLYKGTLADVAITTVLGEAYNPTDWLQCKLVMDVSATDEVVGTMYARNLTQYGTSGEWHTHSSLTDVTYGTYSAADWNSIRFRLLGGGGVDNVTITPEPTTLGLLAIGGGMALLRRKK